MTIQVTPIANRVANNTDADTLINLFSNFDDPLTTGKIARFELFDSSLAGGVTQVVLFDQVGAGAPQTVQNFQTYVNDGDYRNSLIHRSEPGFVLQGGGFVLDGLDEVLAQSGNPSTALSLVPTDDPIDNEFSSTRSNVRGTIAMAKVDGNPDSATSQWFFNLADNSGGSARLDTQNGGFTVFGAVMSEDDLDVLDAIAALPRGNGNTFFSQVALGNMPLILDDPSNPSVSGDANFVRYRDITIRQVDELQFSVVSNTNSDVVTATIHNNQLVLDYLPGQAGTADITVRATNLLGEILEDTFRVTVEAIDDGGDDGGTDRPRATPGDDNLRGTAGNDVIRALAGNDIVSGLDGNDRLVGQGDNDRLTGGNDRDDVRGGSGADKLFGNEGADLLQGNGGNDVLNGGTENDVLNGGTGNDRLQGDRGNDTITTGKGRDRVIIGRQDGLDTVTDFKDRLDKIQLLGRLDFEQLTIRQRRDNALISVGNANLCILENIDVERITQADFV